MKLNLGCGHDYVDDWVNVDFYDNSKCDVVHDLEKFPCIRLAYEALNEGGTFPVVLNVANDEVVAAFLNNYIQFIFNSVTYIKVSQIHFDNHFILCIVCFKENLFNNLTYFAIAKNIKTTKY